MDFFINLGIVGISLIILGKASLKNNNDAQEFIKFKILNKFMNYMDSELLAKINLKYGKLLLITGILGTLFYNTLGLFMVLVMVLVMTFYLISLFTNAYKFFILFH